MSGAGPSGAGARLAASATAVTRSQRASESARWHFETNAHSTLKKKLHEFDAAVVRALV
jgi:hypothetical protein